MYNICQRIMSPIEYSSVGVNFRNYDIEIENRKLFEVYIYIF